MLKSIRWDCPCGYMMDEKNKYCLKCGNSEVKMTQEEFNEYVASNGGIFARKAVHESYDYGKWKPNR